MKCLMYTDRKNVTAFLYLVLHVACKVTCYFQLFSTVLVSVLRTSISVLLKSKSRNYVIWITNLTKLFLSVYHCTKMDEMCFENTSAWKYFNSLWAVFQNGISHPSSFHLMMTLKTKCQTFFASPYPSIWSRSKMLALLLILMFFKMSLSNVAYSSLYYICDPDICFIYSLNWRRVNCTLNLFAWQAL